MSQPLAFVGQVVKVKVYGIPNHGYFFMEFNADEEFREKNGNSKIEKKLADMIAFRERNIDGIHEGGFRN